LESEEIVKIEISKKQKYAYFLTNFDGLLISEFKEEQEEFNFEVLTEEEIYNFCCIGEDICIAFAVQRSTVMIFKGKKLINVVHSDDETVKNPFLTGISHYVPEISNKLGENENPKFLWLEGRLGVKYLEYNAKEYEAVPGELMNLWSNDLNFNNFVILTVEEMRKKELIIGLAFEERPDNMLMQVFDVAKRTSQSFLLKDHPNFGNTVLMTLISMAEDTVLIGGGYLKSEDDQTDSMISVLTLEDDGKKGHRLNEVAKTVFKEYDKFMNLKKINESEFFVCGKWDLILMKFEDQALFTCYIFEDLHIGLIFDVCVFQDSIYTVSEGIEELCKKITFEGLIPGQEPETEHQELN
jgi:hypothetical protein